MKVIFISIDGLTDPLGQSQILPYLLENSVQNEIHVITLEKSDRYSTQKNIIDKQLKSIVWHPIMHGSAVPIVSQLFNFLRMFLKMLQLVITIKPNVLHARSYLPCFAALMLKLVIPIKIVFDMRGFWPDERIEGGVWKMKNPIHRLIYRFIKTLEQSLLKKSDHIISLTYKAKEIMMNQYQIASEKISVIPCAADLDFFNPHLFNDYDKIQFKTSLGFNANDLIICYQGSLGTWYMTTEMIACVKAGMKQNNRLKWLVLSNDKEVLQNHPDFTAEIEANTLITSALRIDMPKYLSIVDIGLFFIIPTFSKQASSPTKLAELMAMGIPVISNAGVGDVDRIINESKSGIVLHNLTLADYQSAADAMNELIQINKQEIRNYAAEHFKHSDAAAVYATVYQKITI